MDPLRIAVRAAFAYAVLLTMVRLSGKQTVAHGTTIDVVLALIFGDMVDDLVWGEVGGSQFVVGAGTLFISRLLTATHKVRRVVQAG
jgi:uncharacterized membrane protein YcaP (DUF421 family)